MGFEVAQIVVNGQAHEIDEPCALSDLLTRMGLEVTQLAVELNQAVVPRAQIAQTQLKAGDRLEIVTFVGGG